MGLGTAAGSGGPCRWERSQKGRVGIGGGGRLALAICPHVLVERGVQIMESDNALKVPDYQEKSA